MVFYINITFILCANIAFFAASVQAFMNVCDLNKETVKRLKNPKRLAAQLTYCTESEKHLKRFKCVKYNMFCEAFVSLHFFYAFISYTGLYVEVVATM